VRARTASSVFDEQNRLGSAGVPDAGGDRFRRFGLWRSLGAMAELRPSQVADP